MVVFGLTSEQSFRPNEGLDGEILITWKEETRHVCYLFCKYHILQWCHDLCDRTNKVKIKTETRTDTDVDDQ